MTLRSASATLPAPASWRRLPQHGANGAERLILDEARVFSEREDLPAAIEALANHARQFPGGQYVVERNAAWSRACARYRTAHPQGEAPNVAKHCAGR